MSENIPIDIAPFLSPNLKEDGLRHGFFTRVGGQSEGLYQGLNCGLGSQDNPHHVLANRQAVLDQLSPQATNLCGLYQIHSNQAHLVEGPWQEGQMPQGDAMVTTKRNIALGILTADCAPILFADRQTGVIGAAHAGWQGALTGVIESTLRLMEDQGARLENIRAAVGPCIAQKNYEVGPEFRDKFITMSPGHSRYFKPSSKVNHYLFDLKAFVGDRLSTAGVSNIEILPHDTYAQSDLFYSYRRSTHQAEPDYGRQISCIMLT